MVGWHHWLNGPEFEQTLGDSEGQKPGMLQFTRLQRVRQNLATEQQQFKKCRNKASSSGSLEILWTFSKVEQG